MTNRNEQKFYSALKDVFVGEKVEGESGYVNLMKIKNQYFEKIKPFIENEINETISDESAREELFEKLYTFFESYFSDTGTPFFDKTQLHKNLYEKVYTERDDVSLFWKTQKLYYVKSETNYTSMDLPDIDGFKFVFDASEIEHQKSNEKKSLEFYLTETEENKLTFKVRYIDNTKSKWDRLKNYLDQNTPAKVRKHLAENLDEIDHGSINVISNSLDRTDLRPKFIEDNIIIKNNDDSIQSVDVEFSVSKLNNLETYFAKRNIIIDIATVKKVFTIYKKQNEVDYFIHKDAEGFLKEQFDIYLYNYLFGEGGLESDWQQDRINDVQNIKKIAHTVIEYIARFEDELKAIWEKPKFVRNSNYVFTLDRIKENVELIENIINHEGFEKQVEEWKKLGIVNDDFSIEEIVTDRNLSDTLKTLPIDTKYLDDIKDDVMGWFEEIEENLNGLLIKSDNYQGMLSIKLKYNNKIDLIYIDPPFNTGDDFFYKDKYQTSTWLTLMNDRLIPIPDLLKREGALYLHLDENANYFGRILLAELGFDNIQELTFDTNATKDPEADLFGYKSFGKRFVLKHNTIYYCFNNQNQFRKLWKPNRNDTELSIGWLDLIAKPKIEKPKKITDLQFFIEKYKRGRLSFSEINVDEKVFPLGDFWNDIYSFTQSEMRTSENISFLTQKPENLLRRIVQSSTEPGHFIMDYFSGSGTTIAVAHKLSRKWIGIEMGEHFNEFYSANNNGVSEEKLGILGRLKIVLRGDKKFKALDKDRRSHLSKDINWGGGGFFKYYELEQFEDALRLAKYNPKDDDLANVNFQKDEKLLDAVEIDRENENVKIHFETLYPDVDIGETLSNLLGKKIKKLNDKRVIFEDDMEIIFDEMTYEKYPWVKPLIWWKSK